MAPSLRPVLDEHLPVDELLEQPAHGRGAVGECRVDVGADERQGEESGERGDRLRGGQPHAHEFPPAEEVEAVLHLPGGVAGTDRVGRCGPHGGGYCCFFRLLLHEQVVLQQREKSPSAISSSRPE
jgi:hypothetical protein